jgi:hypothetical protein
MTPHAGKLDERKVDVSIYEFTSGALLCALEDRREDFSFRVSRDRRFLALKEDSIQVFDLASGVPVPCPLDRDGVEYQQLVFAPDSQSALLASLLKLKLINLNTLGTIRELPRSDDGGVECRYDPDGHPKYYLEHSLDIEKWDVLTGKRDWLRTLPKEMSAGVMSHDQTVLVTFDPVDPILDCWCAVDGRLLARVHSDDDRKYVQFSLSPDGRFMVYGCSQPHWLEPLLRKLPDKGSWKENIRFEPSVAWNVCDTHTGSTWPRLPASQDAPEFDSQARFLEYGSQLNSMDDHGIYEWDVPPRWQYFTPWAWPAFAAWVTLLAIGWKLRKTA